MDHLSLVPVATGLTPFEAKVLAAQLGADGILFQVRGSMDSVYPVGTIEVLVPAAELDDARALLGGGDYDEEAAELFGLRGPGGGADDAAHEGTRWWVAALAVSAAVTFFCMRLLAFG